MIEVLSTSKNLRILENNNELEMLEDNKELEMTNNHSVSQERILVVNDDVKSSQLTQLGNMESMLFNDVVRVSQSLIVGMLPNEDPQQF